MGNHPTIIVAARRLAALGVLLLSACGHPPAAPTPAQSTTTVAHAAARQRKPHLQPQPHRPTAGGWIAVCATNVNGMSLDLLHAWCRPADAKRGVLTRMPLRVADGTACVWPMARAGVYHFYFKAPGHVMARDYDAVWPGQTTTIAAVFEPLGTNVRVITGVVLDALTRRPLAGVVLRDSAVKTVYAMTEWTRRTDTAGTFRVALGHSKLTLRCTHAGYLPGMVLLHTRQRLTNMTVCLSPPAQLRITALQADGAPVSNAAIYLFGTTRIGRQMLNHATVFSNVPAGVALSYVLQRRDLTLMNGTMAPLAPHSRTNVVVQLQHPGRLVLRFSELISSNIFGTSVCVESCALVSNGPSSSFASSDFVAQDDTWVMADLVPATYRVRIHGTNAIALATNVVIRSAGDTILDLCAGANSIGAITGSVDDGTAAPKTFYVRAVCAATPHIVNTIDVDDTNVFCVAGLDLQRTYDLQINAVRGSSITNLMVANVRPNGAPLHIILDRAYVVRGTAVDQDGAPVKLKSDSWGFALLHAEQQGRFVYGPVPAGPCRVSLRADGFAPYFQDVLIEQHDVDLGTITLIRGIAISGRVLDDHGNPCPDADVVVVNLPCASFGDLAHAIIAGTKVDGDGYFCASNVTPGLRCSVAAAHDDKQWAVTPALTLQTDCNVGSIYLRRPPWYEITFRAPDGAVLHNIEVLGLEQDDDNPDVWKGREPPTIALFDAVLMLPAETSFARHLAFLNAAFVPCPTGYAPTNRMTVAVPAQWYRQSLAPR